MRPTLANTGQHCSDSFVIKRDTSFSQRKDVVSGPDPLFLLLAYISGEIPVPILNSFDGRLHELSANLELIIRCRCQVIFKRNHWCVAALSVLPCPAASSWKPIAIVVSQPKADMLLWNHGFNFLFIFSPLTMERPYCFRLSQDLG